VHAPITVDAPPDRSQQRFDARVVLWSESTLRRLRHCGRVPVSVANDVILRVSGAGDTRSAGFAGLQSCGSVWSCPVCSAKIAAERQQEVARAIRNHQVRGGQVLMLTLTMRHSVVDSLRQLWSALGTAWHSVTSGKAWADDKAMSGLVGYCRVVEVTYGASGWHVHVHSLLFLAAPCSRDLHDHLAGRMFARWSQGLKLRGLRPPIRDLGGLDVRVAGNSEQLASYFNKQTYDGPDRAAWEVMRGDLKEARHGNRTPFRILRDLVVHGLADDLDLWHEFETVSRGKRQLTWSKGLRDSLELDVERTDDEIAAENVHGDDLVVIPADVWRTLCWTAGALLRAARSDDTGDAVFAWLRARGVVWHPPGG
jgi:hypothetical protein